MPQIQLDTKVFEVAQRRAADEGYASVDAYISDVVVQDSNDEDENFDHLFTPERIAKLKQSSDEVKAGGKTYSMEEVRHQLEEQRRSWLAMHGI
jgi:hypothetical protein